MKFSNVRGIRLIILTISIIILGLGTDASAGDLINEHLPDWVNIDVELRHRYEFKNNFDFNDATDDDKGFNLKRTRINVSLTPIEEVKLFYQFQDSKIFNDSIGGSKAGFEDWAETRQLWIQNDLSKLDFDFLKITGLKTRFGRQELSYGAQRLLGGFNWSNIAQTFDAGKVMLFFDDLKLGVDIFGGGKTPNKSPREADDFFDGASNDRVGGYYATYEGLENAVFQQYVINRNTNGKTVSFGQTGDGEVDDYTIGGRIKGNIPDTNFDYELEIAKQFGDSGSLDVNAQMAVAILGYTFADMDWKPRISFEFDYASGDNDSADGDRTTFDNLYPTNHLYYGYMDFASLQNINNYHFQITAKPHEKLGVQADLHLIYLDTADDHLYSAGRTVKRSTVAGADTHVGNEIDLKAKYTICEYADMLVGYSHFFAGDFLEDTGTSDDADFFYVQTTLKF